ncbi:TIGR02391 family protein [Streptomyces mirabilis]|uniref:TIGR02391 family protein n=1 Tax=Streptomyces mirabilis TaxID=68239 RepID=UPI0036974ED6
MEDDGSDTFRSVHRGAMALAEGCYAAIRNPNSHEDGLPELPEHEALEQLAAFSLLARWVDAATARAGPRRSVWRRPTQAGEHGRGLELAAVACRAYGLDGDDVAE